jgi:hypothetical protein
MLDTSKQTGDMISLGATLGSLAGLLPSIAALASLIWTCIRIYEWFQYRKQLKQNKKNESFDIPD